VDVDPELLDLGRQHVAHEFGVGPHVARLQGRSMSELRADAAKVRAELGMPPLDDGRDAQGHFAKSVNVNTLIRRAAGRVA
jgi:hypothetical protein